MVLHLYPNWIVESRVIEHVKKDCGKFVEYHRWSDGLNTENGVSMHILGTDTYKLELSRWHFVLLHEVLYFLQVWQNLLSIINLLKLGFILIFVVLVLKFYLGTQYYGCGIFMDNFAILNIDYSYK